MRCIYIVRSLYFRISSVSFLIIYYYYYYYYYYEDFLKFLKFRTLHNRKLYLDALFFIPVYSGLKWRPSHLDITGVQVLLRNFRSSSLFPVSCKNSQSARRVAAANLMCKDVDNFTKPITSLKQTLRWSVSLLYQIVYGFFFFWGGGLWP